MNFDIFYLVYVLVGHLLLWILLVSQISNQMSTNTKLS